MEFKRLSDVEVVAEPTESANVLIEEDGVIKKAPKTAVGGGSTEWDAVIEISSDYTSLGSITVDALTLVSGGYDAIAEKAAAGEQPKVLFRWKWWYGDLSYSEFWTATSVVVGAEDGMSVLSAWYNCRNKCGTFYVELYSDNIFNAVSYNQW